MTDAEILREARRYIQNGRKSYICNALDIINCDPKQTFALQRWIKDQLDGVITLEMWLLRMNYVKDFKFDGELKQKLINTRLNWIDNMIKIVEEE